MYSSKPPQETGFDSQLVKEGEFKKKLAMESRATSDPECEKR
jgi:hypothetical protein